MPKIARAITAIRPQERKKLLRQARLVLQHPGLDVRAAKKMGEMGHILIVTPKKVGTAPERNLIRRRFKAIFYEEQLYEKPFDLIIFAKKDIHLLSFQDLKSLLKQALERATHTLS